MPIELANPDHRYAWTDLETTGLDEDKHCIIQVASVVTDGMLQELDSFETLVAPFPNYERHMNDYVRNMHTENGLLETLRTQDPPSVEEAGNSFTDWLRAIKNPDGHLYFCGNSIHGVDWPFLNRYMPQTMMDNTPPGPFHYRAVDVSGIRIGLGLATGYNFHYEKRKNHTAMEDVRECIEEFKYLVSCVSEFYTSTWTEMQNFSKLAEGQIPNCS